MTEIKTQTQRQSSMDQKESVSKSMYDYNNHSNTQLKWIKDGKDHIERAASLLPSHDGTIQIADFGCSYGKNLMFVLRLLFDQIQKREDYTKKLKKLVVYHEDLPDNDFDAVKNCVLDPEIGYPHHNLVKSNNIQVNTECIGKTYYEQIVESNSIDMAFCYTSLHWMPEYRPSEYGLMYKSEYGDKELTQWFDDMSSKYLSKWLDLRHEELKQGGLISFNIMTDFNFTNWMNQCWIEAFNQRGLDHKNFTNVHVPVYNRNPEVLHNLLDGFALKFRVITSEPKEDRCNISRSSIRAGFYNQIVAGLAQYSTTFPTESDRVEFYDLFESICFQQLDYFDLITTFEWIILQKL